MASIVRIAGQVSAKDVDGTRFVYPEQDITVWRVSDRAEIGSGTTDEFGNLPDIEVDESPGTAVLLTVEPYRGITGTVLVYTVADE